MLKAWAIWTATKDQLQDMINLLELAQVSTAEKRHMQAAQLAAEREARTKAGAKASFPHASPRGKETGYTAKTEAERCDTAAQFLGGCGIWPSTPWPS